MLTAAQRRVLSNARYRRLWIATSISELGSNVGRMAFILLVHQLARESGEDPEHDVALIVLLETIPMLLLGPVAGALVDRLDRRGLLVACDLLSVVLMLAIPWLALLSSRAPLFAVAAVFSAIGTVFHPARQSALPDLVQPQDLPEANGISTTTSSVNLIAGMALAGVLIELLGKVGTFVLTSVGFGVSAFLMMGLVLPPREDLARRVSDFLREALRGVAFLVSRPVLVYLTLVYFLTYGFVGAWITLLPSFTEEFLAVDPDRGAPLLIATFGLGGVLGGVFGPRLGGRLGRGRVVLGALLSIGLGMTAFALSPYLLLSLALVVAGGALMFSVLVPDANIVHETVPPDFHGRVFAARYPMQALGYLVATSSILLLASSYRPQELMLGASLVFAGAVVATTLLLPGARALYRL